MRLYLISIICILLSHAEISMAQPTFQRTYGTVNGDQAYDIVPTADGNYFVSGYYETDGFGSSQFYLNKIDPNGDSLWIKTFGARVDTSSLSSGNAQRHGTGGQKSYDIFECSGGGFMMAGETHDFGVGGADFYLVKLTATGDTSWTKTYGGPNDDVAYTVTETQDNGYVVGGFSESFGVDQRAGYILKINSIGDTLWTLILDDFSSEGIFSIKETVEGNYLLAGYTFSFGEGGSDMLLVKVNPQGDVIWQKTYGGSQNDFAYEVLPANDSGYILAGSSESYGAGAQDICILKLDTAGTVQWNKTYGDTDHDGAYSIITTSDNNYLVTGYSRSTSNTQYNMLLMKIDNVGDTIWTSAYGGSQFDYGEVAIETPDGGFIAVGYTNSYGSGVYDVYIVKTDSMGSSICDRPTSIMNQSTSTPVSTPSLFSADHGGWFSSPLVRIGVTFTQVSNPCTSVGIDELDKQSELLVYPNPTNSGEFNLQINGMTGMAQITVYDLTGRMLNTDQIKLRSETILNYSTENLIPGTYFVHVLMEEKELKAKLMVH
jgi:hypothetical protein